jgi:hypothetical protein
MGESKFGIRAMLANNKIRVVAAKRDVILGL